MQTIRVTSFHDVQHWAGTFPQESWIDRVITEEATVLKPDGSPLLIVLRKAIDGQLYQHAYNAIAPLARSTGHFNRGIAAGKILPPNAEGIVEGVDKGRHIGMQTAARYRPFKKDGTLSKTVYAKKTPSQIVGFADRSPRFPYCRQTVYTNRYPDRMTDLLPCLQALDTLFASRLPHRHAAQQAMIDQTSTDFYFPGTTFTTVTVNRNWQTALHRDAGDLAAGFGVMLCLRAGQYTGGLYVMPAFGVAVDLQAGDVILSDVHEWHGNTALAGDESRYERITMVCYYRQKMIECLSMAEEVRRVRYARGTL